MRFKIVIPTYNALPWLEKTLQSIEMQTDTGYDVCIIDDATPDPKQREVIAKYAERNGWKAIYNQENQGALANHVAGIAASECADEDVVIQLDGDDWLSNPWVLERLRKEYQSDILMTYSQYLCWGSRRVVPAKGPSWWTKLRRAHRTSRHWCYQHLRTFKYHLWRLVRDEDLRNAEGNYFATACDAAMMYPMLEMAGSRARFIPEVFLIYNDYRPDNDYKKNHEQLSRTYKLIKKKKKNDAI